MLFVVCCLPYVVRNCLSVDSLLCVVCLLLCCVACSVVCVSGVCCLMCIRVCCFVASGIVCNLLFLRHLMFSLVYLMFCSVLYSVHV